MKKILVFILAVFFLWITACSSKVDFDSYVSNVMYMYDDVEGTVESLSHFHNLEELLVVYSDLSVKLEDARNTLDSIWKYGSDKFLYNSAYNYLNTIQNLYQNDLNNFVMSYAKDKDNTHKIDQQLAEIVASFKSYDASFEKDLETFIDKYDKKNAE